MVILRCPPGAASIRDRPQGGRIRGAPGLGGRARAFAGCLLYASRSAIATDSPPTIFDTRRQQVFPLLSAAELLRVRRFGQVQSFGPGESVTRIGEPGHGLTVVLSGQIVVTRQLQSGAFDPIVTHGPGSFM